MTDEELISAAEARTSLSHPYHEMEMQRRLKDSIDALALETRRARWWAFWGTLAIVLLTAVLIALTVVLFDPSLVSLSQYVVYHPLEHFFASHAW